MEAGRTFHSGNLRGVDYLQDPEELEAHGANIHQNLKDLGLSNEEIIQAVSDVDELESLANDSEVLCIYRYYFPRGHPVWKTLIGHIQDYAKQGE